MASVSILVPASRPDYLGRALLSAQSQTYTDIEILVGDDTAEGSLAEIVERFDDPRVRYFHHGFGDRRRNAAQLWERASGKYVKWLSGDDVLMPTSVEALTNALAQNPDSPMAFHGGVFVGENDAIHFVPPALLNPGQCGIVTRQSLVDTLVAELNNYVGEPSNVMLVRDRVDMNAALTYGDWNLDSLVDVAMYLNLAGQAPLVAVGGYLSALRRAAGPTPMHANAASSAAFYEWEMIVRKEAAQGNLSTAGLKTAQQRLKDLYTSASAAFPELGRLQDNLDDLTTLPPDELVRDARFQDSLAFARAAAAERAASPAPVPTAHAQKYCVVCENEVPHWLAVPGSGDGTPGDDFFGQVRFTGSALHKYGCPSCHCNDRDRHLWLYFAVSGVLENASQMRILHIAPEVRLEPRIRALGPREYIVGDLFPRSPEHRRINVEALDFPEGYFDLIICNHVLEHVDDPRRALAEFNRCLAPGGHLVAQTPYSPRLKHTFELNTPASTAFKTQYFGQDDHVRMFGADIADYFHAAGLQGGLYPHETVLAEADADQWGCNEHEPFFLFRKGALPALSNGQDAGATQAAAQKVHAPAAPAIVAGTQPRKPVRLVVATRYSQADFETKSALGRSLKLYNHTPPQQLLLFDNNTTGLPTLYNRAIEHARDNPAVLVFVHDDVSISDFFWVDRIHEALTRFDVVGLAGNTRRMPHQPAWCFTPDLQWDERQYLSGVVGHGKGFPCDLVSNFGPSGQQVKLLDGLMLVADSERLIESGLRFDERFDFHFYDMDLCRQAEEKGLSMGTWPISVVHESGGAFGTPSWRAAYERYLQKYTD